MKYLLYFLASLIFFLNTNYAQSDPAADREILEGLNDIYNLKFDDAQKKFKRLQISDPDDLKGFFYESLIYFYEAMPTRDEKIFEKYLEHSENVIERAEKILDKNENDYDALYYKGLSHSYRSLLMLSLNKSLMRAASNGNDGYRILSSLIEKKPDYYDAYMGLGLYKIAIGFVPEKFQWLLSLIGFKGNIKEGMSLLTTSMQKGKFTKTDSKVFLSLFSLKEREEDDRNGLELSGELVSEYPGSAVFKVFYSGILLQYGNVDEAISAAEDALKLNTNSFQSEIKKSANALLGTAYFRLNDFQKAADHFEEYIKYVNPEDRYNVYLYTLGISQELNGNRDKALEKYKNVRNNFINERDGELDKFFYRLAQEKIKKPVSEFDILLIKGLNLRESNKPDEAIKVYEDLIDSKKIDRYKNDDDLIRFYYDYGLANVYNKNPDKAIEYFNRCIKLNPENETWLVPHSYFELGKLYSKKGDKKRSEEMFEKIFDYDNFDFESFLEMRLANFVNK
ncbi:MAG: tetratricopeptide repeat protein [Ignavibacteria bacterium]